MPRDWRTRADDILAAIERVRRFTPHDSEAQFAADERAVFAVAYAMLIVGEAANSIPEAVRETHSEIPWHLKRGIRNVIAHATFDVDPAILWETAKQDLPTLERQLQEVLANGEVDSSS